MEDFVVDLEMVVGRELSAQERRGTAQRQEGHLWSLVTQG